MSKAYSNKALPSGTILREWELEEVLGVGGFGIVYKARGIYFNELVAIKEYFPSAISERVEDATVVPVDSDAEEVHALGLKKFVEEAKLLWNLSTPSRHPNIVSVRSLFEVHGTAYMVMDFEDGTSLSKLLKNGVRFNEASLKEMIIPMAQGLERAHRVGVLHRDIKPPNIILSDSGRSVLIDFGSARFESGEATSTTVTFHTPPYAAIEQYVKTFKQGPWTDIYALGVVLYECVTGSKPLEVLERMHGNAGDPLSEGNWPGFSKPFLAAIDAAMQVRPEDRPQSIAEWLPMLGDSEAAPAPVSDPDFDEDATRIMTYDAAAQGIVPVAPPPPGFGSGETAATKVPSDPKEAQFKGAGGETNAGRKTAKPPESPAPKKEEPKKGGKEAVDQDKAVAAPEAAPNEAEAKAPSPGREPAAAPAAKGAPKAKAKQDTKKQELPSLFRGKNARLTIIGGAILVAAVGGWLVMGGGRGDEPEAVSLEIVGELDREGLAALVASLPTLASDAREAGVNTAVLEALDARITALEEDASRLAALAEDADDTELSDKIKQSSIAAAAEFASALAEAGQQQVDRALRTYPWADPAAAGQSRSPAQRQAALRLSATLEALQAANATAGGADNPTVAVAEARNALQQYGNLRTEIAGLPAPVLTAPTASAAVEAGTEAVAPGQAITSPASPPATATSAAPAASAQDTRPVTATQRRDLARLIDRANDLARDVIRLERRDRPGSGASEEEQQAYRIRQADAQTAQEYQGYLQTLEASLPNVNSRAEADRMIQQVNETHGYLQVLYNRSNATLR
jgi:serine/threonine protein kinase